MALSRRKFLAGAVASSVSMLAARGLAQTTLPTQPAARGRGARGGRGGGGGRGQQPPADTDPRWEQIRASYKVPQWLQDGKFGIYAHWGVYSVPAYGNEWYPRNMYMRNSPEFAHHQRVWGDQSKFGYKDFIPMFQPTKWDPAEWSSIYKNSGAKYAGPVAEHHDGFSLWDSQCNRWNSVQMGPRRNIVAELTNAIRKEGLKIFISMHHDYNVLFTTSANGYFPKIEGFDTADPKYRDFYGNYSSVAEAYGVWRNKTMEVIDKFMPDQLYFDGWLRDVPEAIRIETAMHYYDMAAKMGKEVTMTYKSGSMPVGTAFMDVEKGGLADINPVSWQTDDSIANPGWSYIEESVTGPTTVKPFADLLRTLIDNVSKNGNFLLNCCLKGDGTFPLDQQAILASFGKWLGTNGEAIYGSRPWKQFGEGTLTLGGGRGAPAPRTPTGQDFRFTTKGETLYAIAMAWPGREAVVKSLAVDKFPEAKVDKVELLGHDGPLQFKQDGDGLKVEMPADRNSDVAFSLKISGTKLT